MRPSLRHRLLTVALLSVISCTTALVALARILSLTNGQRLERAHDAVAQELTALSRVDSTTALPPTLLGMRGGYLAAPAASGAAFADLDALTRDALGRALAKADASRAAAVLDVDAADVTEVVGAAPATAGSFAWISYVVRPPSFVSFWRLIVASLTLATALLVLTALSAVVSVRRGAASLKASLTALADDLSAPVPRASVRELSDVAEGIASLAQALARAQGDKERLTEELAKRDRLAALGRVAAGIAHEVRNPLASIKLRVDLGRQRPGVPAQLARELGSVSDEITRLDRLVADLLIVAGRRSGPRAVTELGALVRRRVGLLAPWAEERAVTIDASGDATVDIDVDAVSRAIDNLVRNAVEAAPPGTEVAIAVITGPAGARVQVLDHGGGVDQARLPELFEPFFTTKPEGTGLGLALSRAIAAAHGGALTYERRDRTTFFELSLPTAPRPSPAVGARE